jgi:histidinol-phosphate aminotransferase
MAYFCDRIERMTAYLPGEQPEDPGVIKINTNENPYPPSPAVMAAVRAAREEQLRRYPNPTSKPFRCAAARLFGVTPDMVICSNGMDELLRMLIQACCDAGRPLGYPTPTYTLYSVLAETIGAPTRGVRFPPDFSLPVAQLAATDARLFLIVNPNSPTGTFVSIEDIARLAGQVQGRAIVGVDEAYVDFSRDNAMRLVGQFPNVIVMRTLSKGYSLAGLRFGFGIAAEPIIATLNKVKDSYNLDAIAIAAATAVIGDQAYAQATWRKVVQEREKLVPQLRAMGFDVLPSESNFLLATAPKPGAGAIYQALKSRGILVRWWDAAGMSDKLRITVGTPEQNGKLIAAMTEIIAGAEG